MTLDALSITVLNHMNYISLNDYMISIVGIFLADPAVEREMGERLEASRQACKASITEETQKYGNTLREIDANNDLFWRSTRTVLRTNVNHPEDAVREAAALIDEQFETWPQPTNLKYEEEYGALDLQLAQLWKFGEETLARAQILPWVKALQEGVVAFKAKQLEKNESRTNTEIGINKRLRDQLVETYSDVMKRLEAKALLFPDEAHEQLIARLNQKMAEVKAEQKRQETLKKKAADEA